MTRSLPKAIELLIDARGPTDPEAAKVMLHAARIEQARGELSAARARAADAVTAARTWGLEDADLVRLRFEAEAELATLDQALGDLDASESRLLAAVVDARTIARAQRSVLLLTNALAVTYTLAGRLDDAQRCYDDVYDQLQASSETTPDDLARLFHNLAALAHSRGDTANGILWARRGIAIRATLGDEARLDVALDLGGLGALQHLAGQFEEARASYVEAHAATEAILGPEHHDTAVLLAKRAAFEADAGNHGLAEDLYDRALALLTAALGPRHAEVSHVRELRTLSLGAPPEGA